MFDQYTRRRQCRGTRLQIPDPTSTPLDVYTPHEKLAIAVLVQAIRDGEIPRIDLLPRCGMRSTLLRLIRNRELFNGS